MSDPRPGLREAIYLGGQEIAYRFQDVKITRSRAGSHERLADTSLASDYPYPYDGAQSIVRKEAFEFSWARVADVDLPLFEDLDASSGSVDLCLWRPRSEEFIADGARTTWSLSRRIALRTLDPAFTTGKTVTYATKVYFDGILKVETTDYTWGSPTSLGRQPFTTVVTQAANVRIIVRYVPLYLCEILGSDVGYGPPAQETRTLTLEEKG